MWTNVKSLGLDFGVKRCRCTPSSKERYSLRSLQPILMRLENLSRIMLKDAPVFQSDVLQCLPERLEEIHLFNRWSIRSEEAGETNLDLSRYSKLRALTLIEVQGQLSSSRTTKVIGLEALEELIYLRVSGVTISEEAGDSLKNITKLKYLSIPMLTLSADQFVALIENNRNLEYLDISDDLNEVQISQFLPVLTLQRLKCLRMINTSASTPDDQDSENFLDVPAEFEFLDRMRHLEILDCEGLYALPQDLFLQLIGVSPNLKMLNISVIGAQFAEEMLAVVESNVMARRERKPDIRVYVGLRGFKLMSNLGLHAEGVTLCDVPPQKYCEIGERCHWEGWGTQDGGGSTLRLCSQLLKCIHN